MKKLFFLLSCAGLMLVLSSASYSADLHSDLIQLERYTTVAVCPAMPSPLFDATLASSWHVLPDGILAPTAYVAIQPKSVESGSISCRSPCSQITTQPLKSNSTNFANAAAHTFF